MRIIHSVTRPAFCPKCGKPYKVDKLGRCVHCKAHLGGIKW